MIVTVEDEEKSKVRVPVEAEFGYLSSLRVAASQRIRKHDACM